MKRANNLYDRIGERSNLELAFWHAQRGKCAKLEVQEFREHLEEEFAGIQEGLAKGNIEVGRYHYFQIHDPKERTICAARFRERVLHHAIMAVCDETFERYQIYDSYASRKGKGVDACLKRAQEFCGKFRWFLKLDVHKFFDSIDHDVLMGLLNRRFKDQRLLYLFSRIVDSYEVTPGKGIPIGNLTSQYFANLYLGACDHLLKEVWHIPGYVRYMDDFLLFADDSAVLTEALDKATTFLRDVLKLELNPPIMNRCSAGIPFLSYRVFPGKLWLSLKARRRFRRKSLKISKTENGERMLALLAFAERADSIAFRKKVFHANKGRNPNGLEPGEPRRQLEQQRAELPVGEPQQQLA